MILASYTQVPSIDDLIRLVPKLRLVIFDMDGTLVDTEQEHALAVIAVLKKYSKNEIDIASVHKMVFGCPDPYSYIALKNNYKFDLSLEEFLDHKHIALEEVLANNNKEIDQTLKQMQNLVKSIHENSKKIHMTVVTASERKTAHTVLQANYPKIFDQYFGREDTLLSKPFPDPYINAVEVLSKKHGLIESDEILIVEDSPYGLAAGIASGLKVLQACWYYRKN